MFKPYVLELLNSRACRRVKTTPCWQNLHFLTTNRNLHYMAKLPISRALFTSGIPQFQKWLLNLGKGPSAAKGIMKKMHKIPAVQRLLAAPNVRKLINCPCWKNGGVQSKEYVPSKQFLLRIWHQARKLLTCRNLNYPRFEQNRFVSRKSFRRF